MLNYHTTPQISAAQYYVSHITALGGYSLWGDCAPSDGHSEPRLLPSFTISIPLDLIPSASISRRRQEYGEMHMEVYDEPALEGYRRVSLLLFWPQFISVATKATGKSSKCSPQEGRTIKVVSNWE